MATYTDIQNYIKNKYKPKSCWIVHTKEICGISIEQANNRMDSSAKNCPCPENKLDDIKEAFEYFNMQ